MIYLNEPEDGGATRFKTIGKTIPAGDRQAARLEQSASRRHAQSGDAAPGHEGARGTKYVLTKWFRERAA